MIRRAAGGLLLALAGMGRAAEGLPSAAELARAAADRDPRVLEARAAAARVRAESRADLRFPDPQLRGEYGDLEPFPEIVLPGSLPDPEEALLPDEPHRESWRAGLRVNLPNLWTWRAESSAARARAAAADATAEMESFAAGRSVRERALAAAWLARRIGNARAQLRAEDAVCAAVQERVQAGRGMADESVRARLARLSCGAQVQSLEQDFAAVLRELRAATGLELAADPEVWEASAALLSPSSEALEAAQDRALSARPEPRRYAAECRAAEAGERATRWAALPAPAHVEGSWRHDEEWETREGWSVELAITLPVFSAMTPGARRLRALERNAAREAQAASEAAILDDVRAAWDAERAAHAAWEQFEAERATLLGELEQLRRTGEEGGVAAADLERVDRDWRALEDRNLRLQEAAAAARLRLDFATGTPP